MSPPSDHKKEVSKAWRDGYALGMEEAKFHADQNKHSDPTEKIITSFNNFIRKWCETSFPHLIDNDENDGEAFRLLVKQEIKRLQAKEHLSQIARKGKADFIKVGRGIGKSESNFVDISKAEPQDECVGCRHWSFESGCCYLDDGTNQAHYCTPHYDLKAEPKPTALQIEEINKECSRTGFQGCTKDMICKYDSKLCNAKWHVDGLGCRHMT